MKVARLLCALIILVSVALGAGDTDSIPFEVAVQAHLKRLGKAQRGTDEFFDEVVALRALAKTRPEGIRETLGHAIAYAAANHRPRVVKDVAWQFELSDVLVFREILKHYESEDVLLREFAVSQLDGDAAPEVQTPYDELPAEAPIVQALIGFIHERRETPPKPLIRLLYDKAPSAATIAFSRHWLDRDRETLLSVMWTDHVVQDVIWKQKLGLLKKGEIDLAVKALDRSSTSESWWIRLYVAEMIRRHPELGTDEIKTRLRDDTNSLVSKAIDRPFKHRVSEDD